jgi:hypothetical protein
MLPTGDPAPVPTFVTEHGTLIAGVIAARYNNNEGVAGLAGGCRILPLAFRAATDVQLAGGINYAVARGARVINMSFNNPVFNATVVDTAIDRAYDANVVLCASTGYYGSPITPPATHRRVIACGACDQNGRRAVLPNDAAGNPRSSGFGPQISVVAPGISIPTTDIRGAAGADPGNYISNFFGTSAATPHVAGLAALILSRNRDLTSLQVRDIIERTADKTGPDPYTQLDLSVLADPSATPKTWNRFLGCGRINVARALARTPAAKLVKAELKEAKEVEKIKEFETKAFEIPPTKSIGELTFHAVAEQLTRRIDELEELVYGRTFIRPEDRRDVEAGLLEDEAQAPTAAGRAAESAPDPEPGETDAERRD